MRIRLLIVLDDPDYTGFLSDVLLDRYADVFDVSVCSSQARMLALLEDRRVDVVLTDPVFLQGVAEPAGSAMLMLLQGDNEENTDLYPELRRVYKYQRISQIASEVMEAYALENGAGKGDGVGKAQIAVVWSPAGGTGKTTTALAYAARCVAEGRKTVYLNFETFSGSTAFFAQDGKSFSEILGRPAGNLAMLMKSMLLEDSGTGIRYFAMPENYDDIAILSEEEVETIVGAAAQIADVVVIDSGNAMDDRTKKLMLMADKVFAVLNRSPVTAEKWKQFCAQGNFFRQIQERIWLVCNQGVAGDSGGLAGKVNLPMIQKNDPVVVVKNLTTSFRYL